MLSGVCGEVWQGGPEPPLEQGSLLHSVRDEATGTCGDLESQKGVPDRTAPRTPHPAWDPSDLRTDLDIKQIPHPQGLRTHLPEDAWSWLTQNSAQLILMLPLGGSSHLAHEKSVCSD